MAVTNVWTGKAARIDNAAAFSGGFAPFDMSQLTDPVYSVMVAEYGPGLGQEDPGMHYTDTADHFYVIEGEVEAHIVDKTFHMVEADTCCVPGYEAVTLKNLHTDAPSFVFIADESPLHRKLGVYENRG